jgi:hypothetical protein
MRTVCAALVALSTMAALLTGCGGDSGTDRSAAGSSTAGGGSAGLDPSAPITEQLARTFPVPKAVTGSPPGTAAAIKAGRRACKGKTPIEVREEFIGAADGLSEDQEKIIGELRRYEKQAGNSPNFAAGQLGAGVYEATLPEKLKIAGYRGCVYELALQLRRELAKKQR